MIFATNNTHKLQEARAILAPNKVRALSDIGLCADIPENDTTLEGNSLAKALFVRNFLIQNTGAISDSIIADDTGLEVDCLNGAPGYMSARYSGEPVDNERNIDKLLNEMLKAEPNLFPRIARFRTVITYITCGGSIHQVEGIVTGRIATQRHGTQGFGYDAVFIPDGDGNLLPIGNTQTFAQLPPEMKNAISHRARALQKLTQII